MRDRCAVLAMSAVLLMLVLPAPSSAHTAFERSQPSDGATVTRPVERITLTFSGPASPAGSGFTVLDPSGRVRSPRATPSADGRRWTLRFETPLTGGDVAVRWRVKAPDAHPISGAFRFTTVAETPVAEKPATTPEVAAEGGRGSADAGGEDDAAVRAFLEEQAGEPAAGSALRAVGRGLGFAGTILAIGGLVFAWFVLPGRRDEAADVLRWVRRGGALAVLGALLRFAGQVVTESGGWSWQAVPEVLGSSFGVAIVLWVVGGLAMVLGARRSMLLPRGADRVVPRAGVLVGALCLLASHGFDGHTVTEGPRVVSAITAMVHVGAGAVWVGGVAMLAWVLWQRRQRDEPLGAGVLGLRFSSVAAYALAATGVAGLALAVLVLDAPSALWTTAWGRTLLAKLAFVGLAAAMGAYNHRVIVPALADSDDEGASTPGRFRRRVTGEAAVLAGAVVMAALLVGSAA